MKKIFTLILTIAFAAVVCCGCGGADEAQVPTDADAQVQSEVPTIDDNDADDAGYVEKDSAGSGQEAYPNDYDENEIYEYDEENEDFYEEDRDYYEELGDEDCYYGDEEIGEAEDSELDTEEEYPEPEDENEVEPFDGPADPEEPSAADDAEIEELGEI